MLKNKGLVKFHAQHPFTFNEKKKLKDAVAVLMDEEGRAFESLDYIFCSDEYLLEINHAYLKHDDLTDIITFDLSDSPDVIKGEIYISVERVLDNSLVFNSSFRDELARVVFHGALHLCGYKDKDKKDQVKMREKENYYLERF
jgi:probable rRNA maturation factor